MNRMRGLEDNCSLTWHYVVPAGSQAPALTLLQFVAWVAWLGLFAMLQRKLCLQYPGIRSLCLVLYLTTALAVILPAMWVFRSGWRNAPQLLDSLNQVFAKGVYIQTFLRSIFLVKLLYCVSDSGSFLAHQTQLNAVETERNLVALLIVMAQTVTRSKSTRPLPAMPQMAEPRSGD